MTEQEKLGYGIMIGGVLYIGGLYALARLFGDAILISLLGLAGWIVLMAYITKFMGWRKKDK